MVANALQRTSISNMGSNNRNLNLNKQLQQQQQQPSSVSPNGMHKTVKFKLDYLPQSDQKSSPNNNLHPNSRPPLSTGTPAMQQHIYEYEKETNNSSSSTSGSSDNISENDEYITSMMTTNGGEHRQLKVKETRYYEDKHVEKLLEDGTTVTVFPNGTKMDCSADRRHTFVKFFNGDRKEMNHDSSTETYFYAETNITQIIYSNGLQILKFPNGQIEKHHTNKTREIIFPDKICKFIYPDGSEESRLPNGTFIKVDPLGGKVIEYPNKQREIHTKEYKRREYPDGSIKTVYTNGISETKYANGRVRVKDACGNMISDKK
jgi:centromere protein J